MSVPRWPRTRRGSGAGQWVRGSVIVGDLIQVQGVSGNVTITTDRPPYRVETFATATVAGVSVGQARAQPSQLLLARHQVVAFTGRDEQLADLAVWMAGEAPVSVRLVHAAGGQGKTRLAAQVAAGCSAAGWAVWRVWHAPGPVAGTRIPVPPAGGLLTVVDYADRWPASHLQALVTHLHGLSLYTGTTVRVLLLARSARSWWTALGTTLESELSVKATTRVLPPLGAQVDRVELYRDARQRFAEATRVPDADRLPVPDGLGEDTFGQVLAVHMAALVAVDAHRRGTKPPIAPHALSAYLLRREQAHWYTLHARVEDRRQTSPEVMGRAVYVATLTGARPRDQARETLRGPVGRSV